MMAEDYPGLAVLAMTHIPSGDNALRGAEAMLALLKAGGASDQAAAYSADLLSLYIAYGIDPSARIAYATEGYATQKKSGAMRRAFDKLFKK